MKKLNDRHFIKTHLYGMYAWVLGVVPLNNMMNLVTCTDRYIHLLLEIKSFPEHMMSPEPNYFSIFGPRTMRTNDMLPRLLCLIVGFFFLISGSYSWASLSVTKLNLSCTKYV